MSGKTLISNNILGCSRKLAVIIYVLRTLKINKKEIEFKIASKFKRQVTLADYLLLR